MFLKASQSYSQFFSIQCHGHGNISDSVQMRYGDLSAYLSVYRLSWHSFISSMLFCQNSAEVSHTLKFQLGRTDTISHKDAKTHLKKLSNFVSVCSLKMKPIFFWFFHLFLHPHGRNWGILTRFIVAMISSLFCMGVEFNLEDRDCACISQKSSSYSSSFPCLSGFFCLFYPSGFFFSFHLLFFY